MKWCMRTDHAHARAVDVGCDAGEMLVWYHAAGWDSYYGIEAEGRPLGSALKGGLERVSGGGHARRH